MLNIIDREGQAEISSIVGDELRVLSEELCSKEPWGSLLTNSTINPGTQLFGVIVCLLPKLNVLNLLPRQESLAIPDLPRYKDEFEDNPGDLSYLVGGFQSLTRVWVQHTGPMEYTSFDDFASSCFSLPSLKIFSAQCLYRDGEDNALLHTGTSSVEEIWLETCDMDAKSVGEIVRACKNLHTLSINLLQAISLPELGEFLRATPLLRKFTFECEMAEHIGKLGSLSSLCNLAFLDLPFTAIVHVDEDDVLSASNAFISFLPRSLETLTLHMDAPITDIGYVYLVLHQVVLQKPARFLQWRELDLDDLCRYPDKAPSREALAKICEQYNIVL